MKKVIQEHLNYNINRVRRKGEERLTIMVIPHGKEKIFSLQLNWMMILFLSGILLLAVSLTGYAFYRQANQSREVERLKSLYGTNFNSVISLQSVSKDTRKLNTNLRDNMMELGEILGIPEEERRIVPGLSEASSRSDRLLLSEVRSRIDMTPGTNYLPPVYSLKTNAGLLEHQLPLLETLQDTLTHGFGVYHEMPIGRAVKLNASLHDSSPFGRRQDPVFGYAWEFHTGFDTSGPEGTPVFATGSGTVNRILYGDGGYGNMIIIRHGFGFYSGYAHLSRIFVQLGQQVVRGQTIGAIGRTGRVTGPHLHYEVMLAPMTRIDPLNYMCATDLDSATCRRFHRNVK